MIGIIKLDDKKEAVKAGADFDNGSYFFELIDDDKKTDLVISDKSKVLCYDFSGNELFRYESEDENIINVCVENFAKNIPKITENIQGVKVFSPKGKFWKDKAVEFLSN